jgi:hypothetical protein
MDKLDPQSDPSDQDQAEIAFDGFVVASDDTPLLLQRSEQMFDA